MSESKLLEQDKDEWIYHSMNKYSNLYMFELEYPLDSLEILNETSLCVSGVQEYSKKCEILQLCVPPKLLRSEDEEGLCKDRDFKILSGGYAEERVRQIKSLHESSNLVASSQDGYDGIVIFEVGNDDRATILEKRRLSVSINPEVSGRPGRLYTMKDCILMGSRPNDSADTSKGITLYEWKVDQTPDIPLKTHSIFHNNPSNLKLGRVIKFKEWDPSTCALLTAHGTIALYDLRAGSDMPGVYFHATKSQNSLSSQSPSSSQSPVVFSFDALPNLNKIGVIDSFGGYEVFDPRYTGKEASMSSLSSSTTTTTTRATRSLLPDFGHFAGVYPDLFNIEYEDGTKMRERDTRCRFIISGVKKECVPVYEEADVNVAKQKSDESSEQQLDNLVSVFSHDGHSKPVTHSLWHPGSDNLIFSASLDAVLHAWQFIPEKLDNNDN